MAFRVRRLPIMLKSNIVAYQNTCLWHYNPWRRCNAYDGQQEFWIVTKETAERTEETSFEETHTKRSKAPNHDIQCSSPFSKHAAHPMSWQCQADSDPTCQFENKFARLGDLDTRDAREKQVRLEDPKHDKYAQDRVSQKICFLYLLNLGTELRWLISLFRMPISRK